MAKDLFFFVYFESRSDFNKQSKHADFSIFSIPMVSDYILDKAETDVAYFVIAIYAVVVVLQLILFCVWIDVRNSKNRSKLDGFSIFVILSNLGCGIASLPTFCAVVAAGGFQGSPFLCDFQAAQLSFSHMLSLLCVVLYSISCNQRIVHDRNVPVWMALLAVVLGSVFLIIVSTIKEVGFNLHQHPSPSGYYCLGDYTIQSGPELIVNLVQILYLGTAVIVILFMYSGILLKVLITRALSISGDSNSTQRKRSSKKEKKEASNKVVTQLTYAARRSALIPMVFAICWTPYFLCLCYQIISGKYVSAWVDQVASILATFNGIGDFIVFGFVNAVYRKSMLKLFGFKPQSTNNSK